MARLGMSNTSTPVMFPSNSAGRSTTAFLPFASWADVFLHAEKIARGTPGTVANAIWYHAPLDARPWLCEVVRVFKNGKIRIRPYVLDGRAFTVDASHLSRLYARRVA